MPVGRENHDEKDILSSLRPVAGAGHTPADIIGYRQLTPGGVRPGTGALPVPAGHCGFEAARTARRRAATPRRDTASFLL